MLLLDDQTRDAWDRRRWHRVGNDGGTAESGVLFLRSCSHISGFRVTIFLDAVKKCFYNNE